MNIKVVAAIIFYDKRILATQRRRSKNKETSMKYEFPGGKIKKNEDKIHALKRELNEELSIKIPYLNFYYSNSFKYEKFKVTLHFYISRIKKLQIKLNVHKSFKLLKIKDLRNVKWLAADYSVINQLEEDFKDLDY